MTVGDTAFDGEIKVASKIIDYLSSGLYKSPASCLKELVNNSYDADATHVDVFVKPDAMTIVVSDDGIGLSREEFQEHFDHVSESHKRDGASDTKSGRPKVGMIGIGFIAANELCDVMEIVSTKKGSTEQLRVTVDFGAMRKPANERRVEGTDEIVKADYRGVIEDAPRNEHFTHVFLRDVRPNTHEILAGARARPHTAGHISTYGLSVESVKELLYSEAATDWGQFDEYSRTMLQVGLNVPVRYLPGWHPAEHQEVLRPLALEVEKLGFKVYFDGSDLRKPVVLPAGERNLLEPLNISGEHVSARGYLYAKRRQLRPQWLNGVLIRIRHAAVGEYDNTFLGFKPSEQALFQDWTTSEIWADDRLEEALNIDRRTLRETHPAYVELQEAYHDVLSDFLKKVRDRLYKAPATQRRREDASREAERFAEIIDRTSLPSRVRQRLRSEVVARAASNKPKDTRAVLRKYSVAELYDLVLEVARDELEPKDYARFAKGLAERLLS
jgi:hypothetical protein